MRVLVDCDPPLLRDVVSLAVTRLEGVEITSSPSNADVRVTSERDARAKAPRTIVIDGRVQLDDLVAQLSAWVFQSRSRDFPLLKGSPRSDDIAVELRNRGSTKTEEPQSEPKDPKNQNQTEQEAKTT